MSSLASGAAGSSSRPVDIDRLTAFDTAEAVI